jgi:hypothetical protein
MNDNNEENIAATKVLVEDTIEQLASLMAMVTKSEETDVEGIQDFFIGGTFFQLTEGGRKYQVQVSLISDPEMQTEHGQAHIMQQPEIEPKSLIIHP